MESNLCDCGHPNHYPKVCAGRLLDKGRDCGSCYCTGSALQLAGEAHRLNYTPDPGKAPQKPSTRDDGGLKAAVPKPEPDRDPICEATSWWTRSHCSIHDTKQGERMKKRLALIAVVLFALVAGSLSGAQAKPRTVDGHCGEPFTAAIYCEYEIDDRSELKRISWCICYNWLTGEVYTE